MTYLLIWLICGIVAAGIYMSKDRSPVGAFIGGLILGPIAVLLALLTPHSGKKCPACAEYVQRAATVCKHCGKTL
jgi:hypothetical protein